MTIDYRLHVLLKGSLHCALSLAAQCIVIGPVCLRVVCGFVCLWVCYHDNSKQRASILTKLLIKFWPSCAPGKGVCGGAKICGSGLLQPARSVCVSLSAFSFMFYIQLVLLFTA